MLDILIRGGDVVTPQGIGNWSIGIQGERIVSVDIEDPNAEAGRIIDAAGKIVVPGESNPTPIWPVLSECIPVGGSSRWGPKRTPTGWPLVE